jgi:glucose PTS system EIICBA or EIICB component
MKEGKEIIIYSPMKGNAASLKAVGDVVFSSGMLGNGIAIEPGKGRAVAPVAGTISMVFETRHAIGITSDNGVEILIHIGLDTVQLNGKYYTTHVNTGDHVNVGDLLVEFDMESIQMEGYPVITPIIITNTNDYKLVKPLRIGEVKEKDELIKISK